MTIDLVLDARAQIGESPLWVAQEGSLYWADIKAPALHRTHLETMNTQTWVLPADIGAYALDGKGRALLALRTGLYWLDLATHVLTLEAPSPFNPDVIRFNEGACDSAGRFWIGTMTDPVDGRESDRKGSLYSFTTPARLDRARGISPFSPMGWLGITTKVFSTSRIAMRARFLRFPTTSDTGTLGDKMEFIDLAGTRGIPDGAAVDAEGGYWCALHGGGCLHRYTARGHLDRVIAMPVSQPTMCAFVGKNLEHLYVTSAREKLGPGATRIRTSCRRHISSAPGRCGPTEILASERL